MCYGLNGINLMKHILIGLFISLSLMVSRSVEAQTPVVCAGAPICQSIIGQPSPVTEVTSRGIDGFLVDMKMELPDVGRVYFPDFTIGDEAARLLEFDPLDADYCRLLLVGFRNNNQYVNFVDNVSSGQLVPAYAFCTRNNLVNVALAGPSFPEQRTRLLNTGEDFLARLNQVSEDLKPTLQTILSNAINGRCPILSLTGDAPRQAINLNHFATQLAIFIAYDGIETAFDRMFVQAKNPVYIEQYDSIYCLLGIDNAEQFHAGHDLGNDLTLSVEEGLTPLEVTVTFNQRGRHITNMNLRMFNLSSAVREEIAPVETEPESNGIIRRRYLLSEVGSYTVQLVVNGAPFLAPNTEAQRQVGYILSRAEVGKTINVLAPDEATIIKPTPWYMYPLDFLGAKLPLAYFVALTTLGVSLGSIVIGVLSSNIRRTVLLVVAFLLVLIILMLVIVLVLTQT